MPQAIQPDDDDCFAASQISQPEFSADRVVDAGKAADAELFVPPEGELDESGDDASMNRVQWAGQSPAISQVGHRLNVSQFDHALEMSELEQPLHVRQVDQTLKVSQVGHRLNVNQFGYALEMSEPSQPLHVSQVDHALKVSQVGHRLSFSQVRPEHVVSQVKKTAFSQWTGPAVERCEPQQDVPYPSFDSVCNRPLRVVHVGLVMYQAGIEVWLKSLIAHACPRRLQFTRCVVTSTHYDPEVVTQLGVPVDVGAGMAGVQRAAKNCDVMLVSGPPEVGQWLADSRPPLCIGVAHGEGHGTREVLEGCANILDHTIAVSRGVAETVCQGFDVTTIHNGVDAAHITHTRSREQSRAALGFREDDFVVGSVCRLSHEKRPERLIEAIAQLPERFKLLLVGWGPMQASLSYLASRIAPGRVVLVQAKWNLGDYYKAMDAFSLVSDSEGYGLAIMEAMMSQLPVVVTNVGFVPEWIHDRINGVVVDGSAQQIARSIHSIADHPHWAAGLAQEARRTAERFGYASQMAVKYEELLHHLWRCKLQV